MLVWVTAGSRQAVVERYAQAGVELCRADPNNQERAAESFLAWLAPGAGGRPCRWLVVLDDLADPEDLSGLWPPAGPHGRVLVTTRRRDAALAFGGRPPIEVGLFTDREASAYLTDCLAGHGRTAPPGQTAALAADLGYLPLALSQAAAYITDSRRPWSPTAACWPIAPPPSPTRLPTRCPTTSPCRWPPPGRYPSNAPTPCARPAWPAPCST